jgi:hypothetical protein
MIDNTEVPRKDAENIIAYHQLGHLVYIEDINFVTTKTAIGRERNKSIICVISRLSDGFIFDRLFIVMSYICASYNTSYTQQIHNALKGGTGRDGTRKSNAWVFERRNKT